MTGIGCMHRGGRPRPAQRGFSMIEVLIALVVLAFGLLGLALLQTTNLRFTKSADQRTQAVNLATEMLDMIRANHSEAAAYAAITRPALRRRNATAGCPASRRPDFEPRTSRAGSARSSRRSAPMPRADVVFTPPSSGRVTVTWEDEYWPGPPATTAP